jgi:hypothetical protein
MTLAGVFDAWFVGKRASTGVNWLPLGTTDFGDLSGFLIYTDNNVYVQVGAAGTTTGIPYTGTNGALACFKVWRNSSNEVRFKSSGMATVLLGTLSGSFIFDTIMVRAQGNIYNDASNWASEMVVTSGTAATPADDTLMESYISTQWGVTF